MKILILTPQLPYPPHQGTSLRNYHIMRGLAQRHEITLLSFLEVEQTAAPNEIYPLLQLCTALHTIPAPRRSQWQRLRQLLTSRLPDIAHRLWSETFAQKLQQLLMLNQYDIVQIEGIELARYLNIIRIANQGVRVIFDDHNAETELQRRNFLADLRQPRRWLAAAYSAVQVGRLARFERRACSEADGVTAVSATDKLHLQKLLAASRSLLPAITVIPNSIDTAVLQTPPEETCQFDLLFVGKMDYRPNVDAVLWFADAVWSLVRAERPAATWAIVGQKPHERLNRLQHVPGVTVTGWVESVRPYLFGASVVIMSFRVGSGTRLKLIEAMAAGKAIVSTAVGAEGFPVQDGRELALADDADGMAAAVLRLLADEDERKRLGENGRAFAQQYDWRQVIPRFNAVYQAAASR
ncbi:MAG: glycosyltransferase [Anaerolineae bacterium]